MKNGTTTQLTFRLHVATVPIGPVPEGSTGRTGLVEAEGEHMTEQGQIRMELFEQARMMVIRQGCNKDIKRLWGKARGRRRPSAPC